MLDRTRYSWPPDYTKVIKWRQEQLLRFEDDPELLQAAWVYYRTRPAEFISHWIDTYDPRNVLSSGMTRMPFILFPKQQEMIQFMQQCMEARASGLIEKSRDMGATWGACAFSIHQWLFVEGTSVGWGSRKADLVDEIGVPDSIFEKMRMVVRGLPPCFKPRGWREDCMMYMRFINPENGNTITGESGDSIGRGGRKTIYFKDEAAHYEHAEMIEAALSENTDVQIDLSSVNGLGNVFHRKREAGIVWSPGRRVVRTHTNVFIMDWRDHPEKDQVWYDRKRNKAEQEGMLHLFAQEVDRNYFASLSGVIIPATWVNAAIDAHKRWPEMEDGLWMAALDVADGGGDRNALVQRKGVVLRSAIEWGDRDTGVTARRCVHDVRGHAPVRVMYDCNGVGAGVKAEINRLMDDASLPKGIEFVPWNGGQKVLFPDEHVIPDDPASPINKDYYSNLKAQGWWQLRQRFERTWRAIKHGEAFDPMDLISIDSKIPDLQQVLKELSQPTMALSGGVKLMVNKTPPGTKSPNLGDGVMMCYWPITQKVIYDPTLSWVM